MLGREGLGTRLCSGPKSLDMYWGCLHYIIKATAQWYDLKPDLHHCYSITWEVDLMDFTTWELVSWELTSWEDTLHYSPNRVLVPFIVWEKGCFQHTASCNLIYLIQASGFHLRKWIYFRGENIKSTHPAHQSSPMIAEAAMHGGMTWAGVKPASTE